MHPSALRTGQKVVINHLPWSRIRCDCSSREKAFNSAALISLNPTARRAAAHHSQQNLPVSIFANYPKEMLSYNFATISERNLECSIKIGTVPPVNCVWSRSFFRRFFTRERVGRWVPPSSFRARTDLFEDCTSCAQLVTPGRLQWRSSPIPTIPPATRWLNRSWRIRWLTPSTVIYSPWSKSPFQVIIIAVITRRIKRRMGNVSLSSILFSTY